MIRLPHHFEFPGAPDPKLQMQQAGFDLTLAKIERFNGEGVLDFDNSRRELPEMEELSWDISGTRKLQPGGYLVSYNEQVSVPMDCAGLIVPRSSLMRMGAVLYSALWDPGYSGRGQGLMSVLNPIKLYKDARIGQLFFISLEQAARNGYSGKYQGENL